VVGVNTKERHVMVKYALCPGYVRSKTDGDLHYISAPRLAQLYGVQMSECIVYTPERERTERMDDLVFLQPRYHGDYSLR
jgi:hypothetical protein